MDTIRIRKLQFPVYLGVYDAEQEAPRPVVADIELGLDLARVRIHQGDTDRVTYGWGTFASRSIASFAS